MRTHGKVVGAITGLLLVGGLFAAGNAEAATNSQSCNEPVGGGISLLNSGGRLGACIDGVAGAVVSTTDAFNGVEVGTDAGPIGASVGNASGGDDSMTVAGVRVGGVETGAIQIISDGFTYHHVVCPNGASVVLYTSPAGDVLPPTADDLANCVG